jgi:hypothetical protein
MARSHPSSTFNLSAENAISMYLIRNQWIERNHLHGHKEPYLLDTPTPLIIIEFSYLTLKRPSYQQTFSSPLLRQKGLCA